MWIWVAVTLLATLGIFAPHIFGMDGMNGGFAISFACIIVAITGIFVVFMFRGRAAAIDKMLTGSDLLVHWKYKPEEWLQYTEQAHKLDTKEKWSLFLLVMVIAVIVLGLFWLAIPDSGMVVVGVFFGLAIILSITIFITTTYTYWQNRQHQGEVYISRSGAFINHQLHLWQGWGAELDRARYDPGERLIEITYSIPSRQGRDSHTICIPVPAGKDSEVNPVLSALAEKAGGYAACC